MDVALVLVNARKGPLGTTKHHLDMAAVLGVPVVIALSKVWVCAWMDAWAEFDEKT